MTEQDGIPGISMPPLKEDLIRLYLEQKLSAAKIAKVYGLKYASEKTAESTILYHLRRNGIARRDAAAHVRKVTEGMVDEWVVRYQKGESLKDIAGGSVDPVTVFNHLHKRGLQLRDKVEAQIAAVIKFEKTPFSGDMHEKAYLIGLAIGDIASGRHGRAVRVKVSTTHPAMTALFRELFENHGPVYEYPRESPLTGFEWSLDCDLDQSYSFLLDIQGSVDEVIVDDDLFFDFIAGFFDADGSLYFHKKKTRGAFELSLVNINEALLRRIEKRLSELGYSPHLRKGRQDPERGVKNGADHIWRLSLWKYDEVTRLLSTLPIRHREKKAKAKVALQLGFRPKPEVRHSVINEWTVLRGLIRNECHRYIEQAKERPLSREAKYANSASDE